MGVQAEREPEAGGDEQRGEGELPDATCGEVDREGIDGPSPGCEGGSTGVHGDARCEVDRDAGKCREEAVQREDGKGRFDGVNAEDLEDCGEEPGIEGRQDRCGTRMGVKR